MTFHWINVLSHVDWIKLDKISFDLLKLCPFMIWFNITDTFDYLYLHT